MLLYQILANTIYMEKCKKVIKDHKNHKTSAPTWNEELNYLMDYILYQIFMITLNIY